jgi:FkbM family methyltransferase
MMIESFKRTFKFINQHPFAKRHLVLAYYKFCKWQFQNLFNKGMIKKPFIGEVNFYAKKGLTGITGNIYCGLHEFEDMSFLLHFLREEDVFFDIGANVGSYTLLASGATKCKTLCFEPSPVTFSILSQNIKLNKLLTKAKAHNLAIGNETGYLNFTENEDTTNHVVTDLDATPSTTIEVKKLDDFSEESPALLKLDVEGFETEVLNGARTVLDDPKLKAIIIELNGSGYRYGFDENQIHLKLTKLGFQPYQYQPFNKKLILLSTFTSFNTIYIRDLPFVKKRLSKAKPFKLWNEII